MASNLDKAALRRFAVMSQHIAPGPSQELGIEGQLGLSASPCLAYTSPERNEGQSRFDTKEMRNLLDAGKQETLDELYALFARNRLFWPTPGVADDGRPIYTAANYNSTKEEQREVTFQRLLFLRDAGYFRGYLTNDDPQNLGRKGAMHEAIAVLDHSMSTKLGVHIHLWGGALKYLGTKRHHDKWLRASEDYEVAGCFALTELGHGSNVRGIETIATYDVTNQEFVIHTPCETAQKAWIGGAALHANHTVAFAQLHINGCNEGVHAFIVPIRDRKGRVMPRITIADCGHKIGLNGVDNGRIWFDHVRVPRENLLNAMADVTADGRYVSPISDPDQRFAAFMAPLTGGRVTIAANSINQAKVGLSIALRYGMTRRAFSSGPGDEEVLLLDYPAHQRRLLPLLAKTYAMNLAVNELKALYLTRKPSDAKFIHVQSSAYKAMNTWHMMRTLQECREACGGMGVRSDNRLGQLRAEHDVMSTFEGDNNVLMQTVSKSLLADFVGSRKKKQPIAGQRMEHLNGPRPVVSNSTSRSVLRDLDFLEALFRLRTRDLVERLAVQVEGLTARDMRPADAMNESFQLGMDLAKAHAELNILLATRDAVHAQRSGPIQDVLALMTTMYAIVTVDEDPVFLRYKYISPAQAQVIHEEVLQLCRELRPHTLALVTSFGYPQHLLAPIAFDWVDYESSRYVPGATAQQLTDDGSDFLAK